MPHLDDRPPLEELVRASLRQRSEDVEPTPALWEEVDRRVGRRRRWRAVSWSLAGATAVLAAIAIVPGLLDTGEGDGQVPEIAPLERTPTVGEVASTLVFDDDGRLAEFDLTTSETTAVEGDVPADERPLVQLEMRPGAGEDDYAALGVRHGPGPAVLELATSTPVDVDHGGIALPEFQADPEFVPSVAWAPDTDLAAHTLPDEGGTEIVLWETPSVRDLRDGFSTTTLTSVDAEVTLLDWTGATFEPGDESILYVRDGDGRVATLTLTVADDGTLDAGASTPLPDDSVVDVAAAHLPDASDSPLYLLRRPGDGPQLVWESATGGASSGSATAVPIGELPGADPAADADTMWIDGKQDGVLVGQGEQVWLLAHDGRGDFAEPARLEITTSRAALADTTRPGRPDDEPTEPDVEPDSEEAADDPGDEPGDAPTGDGVDVGEGLVVSEGSNLVLVRPDGSTQTLYTFPSEGHSTIVTLSVRPGSTADDLTVALLTQAEGMYDVRWLRAVDGETDGSHLFEPPEAQLATGVDLGSVPAPIWSPEGDLLAFVNALPGNGSELWVVGWDEHAPASDPERAFTQFALDTNVPLRAEQWIWTDDAQGIDRNGELLLTAVGVPEAYALPLERQADGAVALSPRVELLPRSEDDVVDRRQRGAVVETEGSGIGILDGGEVVELSLPGMDTLQAGDVIR